MEVVNMHEAKNQLSKLVQKALAGENVYISNRGNVVVQLTPVKNTVQQRVGGQWKNQIVMEDDFDTLPDEIMKGFTGQGT